MPDRTVRHAESTRCTALDRRGRFCDKDSLPDAPFPICVRHASRLYAYLNDCAAGRAQEAELPKRQFTDGTVYYLRVGDLIKIGHTVNMRSRMSHYPPDSELLAAEPGDRTLETQRHRQFLKELQAGREWFQPSPRLLAHIRGLQSAA